MKVTSGSMQALLSQNSAIHATSEEGEHFRGEYGSGKVYDLSLGNLNMPAPAEVERVIHEVLAEESSVSVHGYMNNAGFADLHTAIADSLQERFGLTHRTDQLIMTTGAATALNIPFETVLNPGGEVLTFAPYSSEYKDCMQSYGNILRFVATDSETFLPGLDALRKTIDEKTRALILNTPNNPSEVVYSEEVLHGIQGVLTEKEREFGNCILVIPDEPYRELVYDGAIVPQISALISHAAVVYSYSEALSLPGERVGWLLLSDSIPRARGLYATAIIANRISSFVSVPLLIQRALKRMLGCHADLSAYECNRALLPREFPKMGYRLVKLEGVFYLLTQAPGGDDTVFAATLEEECALTMPYKNSVYPGRIRLAYCVAGTAIQSALPGLRRTMESYRAKGLL